MKIVNYELKKLSSWFQANKLSINIKKIKFHFIPNKKLDLHFSINDIEIDRVNEVLLLGVILDEHLCWKSQIQIDQQEKSQTQSLKSFCFNKTSLCTLCYSLVYSYSHYCASVWGSTYLLIKRLKTFN